MRVIPIVCGMLQTNCYILIDPESRRSAVIDPADDCGAILSRLKGTEPSCILLTHAHFDHILALDKLRDATGMPVYIHQDDEEMLTDAEKNCSLSVLRREYTFRPAENLFRGGETIALGNSAVKTIHTPGHTKGSSCFLCGKELFTGDTLFAYGAGRTDLYGGSEEAILSSLKKLRLLPGEFDVYPGHGETTTLETERGRNEWLNLLP